MQIVKVDPVASSLIEPVFLDDPNGHDGQSENNSLQPSQIVCAIRLSNTAAAFIGEAVVAAKVRVSWL